MLSKVEKPMLDPHPDPDQHQKLTTSTGSPLAHAYHVWTTSINAFMSHPTHRMRDRQTNRNNHITLPWWSKINQYHCAGVVTLQQSTSYKCNAQSNWNAETRNLRNKRIQHTSPFNEYFTRMPTFKFCSAWGTNGHAVKVTSYIDIHWSCKMKCSKSK